MERIINRKEIENSRREKMQREKPYVLEKLLKYKNKREKGECTPVIEFIFDYKCNMKCLHCANAKFAQKERALTVEDIKNISKQADELGLAQFSLSGGEPLLFDNLEDIVKAMNPEKFQISISTNGTLLTKEKAIYLKSIGVDKVKISVDSIDESVYAKTRLDEDGYQKAINALFNAKNAGLQVVVQTVVSHQTCRTKETEKLAKFCNENGFSLDVVIARAVGRWEGKTEVLIDEEDANYILDLHKKYPVVHRDTFPTYESDKGYKKGCCGTVRSILCITKHGDVMPCVLMHISIGNIFKESLKEIMENGMNIKYFAVPNNICLSGEDREFINKYMSKCYGKDLPVDWREVFSEDDLVKQKG